MYSQEIAYEFVSKKIKEANTIKQAMEIAESLEKMDKAELSKQAGNTKYDCGCFWQDVMNATHSLIWKKFYKF